MTTATVTLLAASLLVATSAVDESYVLSRQFLRNLKTAGVEKGLFAAKSGKGQTPAKKAKAGKGTPGGSGDDQNSGGVQNSSLVAFLEQAPEYEGDFSPSGTVTVRYNPDDAFLMVLDAGGFDPVCGDQEMGCQVSIKSGTSCDSPGEDYFDVMDNPWSSVSYSTYDGALGFSNSASRVDNGLGSEEMDGHVVAVYDSEGNMVGCGLLGPESSPKSMQANLDLYPGYTGAQEVGGQVTVTYYDDNTFNFQYSLTGVEVDCDGCGFHIHAGKSCDTADQVGGHEWNENQVNDLWKPIGGAVYTADDMGEAEGSFNLYNGFTYGKNMGHAVVVHGSDGSRLACGVLRPHSTQS